MTDLRAVVHNRFKLNGLSLSSDASKFLQTAFSRLHDRAKLERAVDKVVASVLRQPLERALIDRAVCETAVRECRTEASDSSAETFCVIEAFDVPRFDYLPDRKKFIKSNSKVSSQPSYGCLLAMNSTDMTSHTQPCSSSFTGGPVRERRRQDPCVSGALSIGATAHGPSRAVCGSRCWRLGSADQRRGPPLPPAANRVPAGHHRPLARCPHSGHVDAAAWGPLVPWGPDRRGAAGFLRSDLPQGPLSRGQHGPHRGLVSWEPEGVSIFIHRCIRCSQLWKHSRYPAIFRSSEYTSCIREKDLPADLFSVWEQLEVARAMVWWAGWMFKQLNVSIVQKCHSTSRRVSRRIVMMQEHLISGSSWRSLAKLCSGNSARWSLTTLAGYQSKWWLMSWKKKYIAATYAFTDR